MKDKQLDDLKQFITTTVSQSEARLESKLASKEELLRVEQKLDQLEQKMEDGFAAIAAPIDRMNDELDDHETRITTLEKRPA